MLPNKTAIVTGGSSGIGKAFVERLAVNNYTVWTISRESEHYNKCMEKWEENPCIISFKGDITRDNDIRTFIELIGENTGKIDLLVNNAGIYMTEDGKLPSSETVYKNLEVNSIAPYRMILYCLPLLEKSGEPIILNITSGAGSFHNTNSKGPLAYRMSKAAVNMMVKSLSYELKERNIAIHAADPGWVKTRLNPSGTDTPENAVEGMWHLTQLHNMEMTGKFWFWGKTISW